MHNGYIVNAYSNCTLAPRVVAWPGKPDSFRRVVSFPNSPIPTVIYTVIRLVPTAVTLGLWAVFSDGTSTDPANMFLLVALVTSALALDSIRRYWHIRSTSRSRKDSTLIR